MIPVPNLMPALPEIFVFGMACVILVADVFRSERAPLLPYALAQLTLIGAAALTALGDERGYAFGQMFVADELSVLLKLGVYAVTFVVFAYSRDYLQARGMYRGEYFVLGLFGVVGMMVMVSASHFLTLYLGLELLSLSLYAMVAFQRDSALATEAAMKYFVLGAMASGMLLYGMSMIYGVTGSLELSAVAHAVAGIGADDIVLVFGLVFIVVGVAFKLGAVPFHMWVPDVYHGAPSAVTLYVGTAPELAAFALVIRLLIDGLEDLAGAWQGMLVVLAVLSMALGNVIAIAQSNIKRMLAYSAISHMGFLLLGILSATPAGYSAGLFYVLTYAAMSAAAFGMVILLSRSGFEAERLEDFKGLNQRSPWHAFLMLIVMFSMAGVPPTVGFYAKLLVIQSVVSAGLVWLAVLSVLFAVIGAYYYLRIVKLMYFDEPAEVTPPIAAPREFRFLLGANALLLVAVMPWVGDVIDWCNAAIRSLP
ncbi:NADH:ubiquinone oxidoreductase subunit N [Sulfurifustis variabilis]|uniref:NADH-quinone oxidoreductase subunit N n=1 Tax=Sulfurifustis variabilis TaxID=1675686 RepID=A0A1B4VAU0_9GAMM|nr:NADH-quinone oxidoreductase subunit NuoN [Sulfurifustis variabilis]BAU48954.1 NADH:ubiquinone oxidoreductase subunit N [Sulfurifustis variabilis]